MSIRKAVERDLNDIKRLAEELGDDLFEDYLARLIKEESVLIAVIDEKVIGVIYGHSNLKEGWSEIRGIG